MSAIAPSLSVRAAMFRAAAQAMPKGREAEMHPHLAGVHIARAAAGGVNLIATDQTDLLIWLRDPEGSIACDATVRVSPSFFDIAKRGQRAAGIKGADDARLEVHLGQAQINPGVGVSMPAHETGLPFIDWRHGIPARAARLTPRHMTPEALDRANAATQILAAAGLVGAFSFEPSVDGAVIVLNWGEAGFALISAADTGAEPMPWRAPLTSMIGEHVAEQRAS